MIRQCSLLLLAVTVNAAEWYVATNGLDANSGTKASPWCLSCLNGKSATVLPGDTIWIRGGTYSCNPGVTAALNGNASNQIIYRGYPGEQPKMDGALSFSSCLTVSGQYTTFRDFRIYFTPKNRDDPNAPGAGNGITTLVVAGAAVGSRFINLVIHDADQGIGFWDPAQGALIYGSLIYYNGHDFLDRGHGHGIYAQNTTGTKEIRDNILWSNWSHGLHGFATTGNIDNMIMDNNVAFENGSLSGFGRARNLLYGGSNATAVNCTVTDNKTYYGTNLSGGAHDVGGGDGCTTAVVTGNRFMSQPGTALDLDNAMSGLTLTGNHFFGLTRQQDAMGVYQPFGAGDYPSNTYHAGVPVANEIFVRPNAYEAGRCNVTVYNWLASASVNVDLSTCLAVGDTYEIMDAQNFFGTAVTSGTYAGGTVAITMPDTGATVAIPSGVTSVAPFHTSKQFGSFIVRHPVTPRNTTLQIHNTFSTATQARLVLGRSATLLDLPLQTVPCAFDNPCSFAVDYHLAGRMWYQWQYLTAGSVVVGQSAAQEFTVQ